MNNITEYQISIKSFPVMFDLIDVIFINKSIINSSFDIDIRNYLVYDHFRTNLNSYKSNVLVRILVLNTILCHLKINVLC